jgi:hypothetical protein
LTSIDALNYIKNYKKAINDFFYKLQHKPEDALFKDKEYNKNEPIESLIEWLKEIGTFYLINEPMLTYWLLNDKVNSTRTDIKINPTKKRAFFGWKSRLTRS